MGRRRSPGLRGSPRLSREELRPSASPTTKRHSRNSHDRSTLPVISGKDQRRSKPQPPPARRSSSPCAGRRKVSVWRMGDVVGAVFGLSRSKGGSSESVATSSSTSTSGRSTLKSLKSSASFLTSGRESVALEKAKSALELREARRKALEREARWDACAGSWNSPTTRSGPASPPHRPPRSQSMPPHGLKHSADSRSFTDKSPATLRLSDMTRRPKPMSQYVDAPPSGRLPLPPLRPPGHRGNFP